MVAAIRRDALAVLNRVDDLLAIWHVYSGPRPGLTRLIGAWVIDVADTERIGVLVRDHHAVYCAANLALPAGAVALSALDTAAVACRVAEEITTVDGLFARHSDRLPRARRPVRPDWPQVDVPPPQQPGDSPLVQPALAMARYVQHLATGWFALETLRVARPYLLGHGGADLRPLPLISS